MSAAGCSRCLLSGPCFNHPITSEGIAPTSAKAAGQRSISLGLEIGPCGLGDALNVRKWKGFPGSCMHAVHTASERSRDGDSWSRSVPSHRSY